MRAYRGAVDFLHRMKIRVLQDFLRTYSGNLIYLDADTAFLTEPHVLFDNLSQGRFVMHHREDLRSRPFMQFLRKFDDLVAIGDLPSNGRPAPAPSSVDMWNASVIGLNGENAAILDAVLAMADAIVVVAPEKPRTIRWVSEQFAFSYFFQAQGAVLAADEYIYHYWDFKHEFDTILWKFFAHYERRSLMAMIEATARIPPQQLHRPKLEYDRLSRMRKLVRKLRGNLWEIPDYEL